jgi:anti-sigma regulatory factor (Ser/Thr protein kinase)
MPSIIYDGKPYKNIILKISITAPFREILKKINELNYPCSEAVSEPVRFAVLELLNNSLRAHREKEITDDIVIDFKITGLELFIQITDSGGGFDLTRLPYDLSDNPESIDVNSEVFQEYREKNHYQRFGMGLLAGKKVFQDFEVLFYGQDGTITPWQPGLTKGTIIRMSMGNLDG